NARRVLRRFVRTPAHDGDVGVDLQRVLGDAQHGVRGMVRAAPADRSQVGPGRVGLVKRVVRPQRHDLRRRQRGARAIGNHADVAVRACEYERTAFRVAAELDAVVAGADLFDDDLPVHAWLTG